MMESADFLTSRGIYWDSLLSDTAWYRRRVCTANFIDDEHIEYNVSLDIDIEELKKRAETSEFTPLPKGWLPVPIVSLRKGLQLDLDLRNAANDAISIETSDKDFLYSYDYFIKKVKDLYHNQKISSEVSNKLKSFIANDDGIDIYNRFYNSVNELVKDIFEAKPWLSGNEAPDNNAISRQDLAFWLQISDSPLLKHILLDLIRRHHVIAWISTIKSSPRAIVKCRRVTSFQILTRPTLGLFGLAPTQLNVVAYGIGTAQREHSRVDAPADTRIIRGVLGLDYKKITTTESSPELSQVIPSKYSRLIDSGKAVVYTRLDKADADKLEDFVVHRRYIQHISILPRGSSFLMPAQICSLGTTLVLFLFYHYRDHALSLSSDNRSSAVTLLLLLPSLFSVLLIQRGEHKIISRMNKFPRWLLLFSSTLPICPAGAITLNASPDTSIEVFRIVMWVSIYISGYFILNWIMHFIAKRYLNRNKPTAPMYDIEIFTPLHIKIGKYISSIFHKNYFQKIKSIFKRGKISNTMH